MTRLLPEERVELGIYNGSLMGFSLKDYNKIAVVSQLGIQCIATASSLISVFLELTRGEAKYFPIVRERLKDLIVSLEAYNPQAVVIIVGGEERLEECQALLRKMLDELAERGFKSDLVVCLRGYLAGCIRDIATANINILSYMELMKYLRGWSILTHDIDLERKRMVFGRITLIDSSVKFEEIASFPLSARHYDLLRKMVQ